MRTLTVEEIAEIAEFARNYPEAAPEMAKVRDPEVLLERVRATIAELNKEESDGQIPQVPRGE